jgi:hypothetical protein
MNSKICPKCQASIRTARSALKLIGAEGVSDIERQIAVSELARSIHVLNQSLQLETIAETVLAKKLVGGAWVRITGFA